MTPEIIFTIITIIVMFVLMVTEVIPLPATMALAGVALCLAGIVEPAKLYSEWGGSTIMFLILMSIIVDALTQTGIVQNLGDKLFTGKLIQNQRLAIFVVCMFCGIATGFLSNTALVVMMAICIGSVITVMAQTVQVTIVDNGEQTSVSMMDPSEESVLKTAVERQLVEPVDGDDQVVFNEEENTLTIRRGLTAEVAADGTTRTVKLY